MAEDKRISELDPADPLTGADEGETLQGGQNRRFSWGQVKNFVGNYFQLLSEKNANSGYAGLYGFKLLVKNAAGLFSSFIGHANTSNRTYTLQDRDGVIADDTDIARIDAIARRPCLLGLYKVDTGTITGPVSSGDLAYDNATQVDALNLFFHYLTDGGTDINTFLALLSTGVKIIIHDQSNPANYQVWQISSTPTFSTPTWTIPVTLVESGGTGTTNLPDNSALFVSAYGGAGGSGSGWNVTGDTEITGDAQIKGNGYNIRIGSTNPTIDSGTVRSLAMNKELWDVLVTTLAELKVDGGMFDIYSQVDDALSGTSGYAVIQAQFEDYGVNGNIYVTYRVSDELGATEINQRGRIIDFTVDDGTDALSFSITPTGFVFSAPADHDFGGGTIKNLADPTDPQDAATKQYVLDNAGTGGGHVIKNNGTPLTARANLNVKNGVKATDNSPDTDLEIDDTYFGSAAFEDTSAFDAAGAAATAETNAKAYADGLVVGLWDDRGSFDASGGAYPTSANGGSGTAGAIKKGDTWTISVAGTLPTGQVVEVGDIVRAIIDTPGNTQANWAIQQNNIGYTAENSANKTDTMAGNTASSTKYLSAKGVYDWVISLGYQVALTAANFGDFIVALTGKTTPVDADSIIVSDSAASDDAKKVSLTNFKAFLKTYFDTLYTAITASESLGASFDGMGAVVLVNSIIYVPVKYTKTLTGWYIVAEGSSPTCTIDIFYVASGTALPTASICASALPALATGNALKSTTLTGWTTSIAADSMMAFKITACANATKITIKLYP
jgi:hypothetical protein